MEKQKNNSHKDHRKRLRDKVFRNGLDCLAKHEIVELLLTYAIPRIDTNPIAHKLLDYFGSFSNIIDANYYDLRKVDGIGHESAVFLNLLSQFVEIYNNDKQLALNYVINTTTQAVNFFREFYPVKGNEFMVLLCLGKNKRVVKSVVCKGVDETQISFNIHNIMNAINDKGVYGVILFHTHPNGKVEPTIEDVEATQNLVNMCLVNKISFDDHIIVNESEHFSFLHNGLLGKMKENHYKIFDAQSMFDSYIKPKK